MVKNPRCIVLISLLMVASWQGVASAEEAAGAGAGSSSSRTLAETLFRQGRGLMDEGRHAEACPKFAESYRLDPAPGTLLGLAICHEAEGRLASAWSEFQEVASLSSRAGREDRAQFAQERIAALEPRLAKATITAATTAPGLIIKLDGVEVRSAALTGVETPMDPGTHTVEATAPGFVAWRHDFEVVGEGARVSVEVPALEPAPPTAVAPAAESNRSADESAPATVAPGEQRDHTWLTLPVKIAGGATLALTAAAIGTGIYSWVQAGEFNEANADPSKTYEEREELRNSAYGWGVANTVFIGAALAGAGVTAYFLITQGNDGSETASLPPRVLPWVSASGGGIGWQGIF